jgi:RimJ/RimL family protein N-acetyltransferase
MIVTKFLDLDEFDLYGEWLKAQDLDTRQLYFGVGVGDEAIDALMQRINNSKRNHQFLVATYRDRWAGTIHIASLEQQVEFGIIVDKKYRGRGIANQMLDEAITWARNRDFKELFMHCLTWNRPIKHLCDKHGLEPRNMLGESEVKIPLTPPNLITLTKEIGFLQRNLFHMMLQKNTFNFDEIHG